MFMTTAISQTICKERAIRVLVSISEAFVTSTEVTSHHKGFENAIPKLGSTGSPVSSGMQSPYRHGSESFCPRIKLCSDRKFNNRVAPDLLNCF